MMYISVDTKREHIGAVEDQKVVMPPVCPKCGGYVLLSVDKHRFYGAGCVDCGEMYSMINYSDTRLGLQVCPKKLEAPSEEVAWLMKSSK